MRSSCARWLSRGHACRQSRGVRQGQRRNGLHNASAQRTSPGQCSEQECHVSGGHPPLAVSWLNLASADPINDKEPYGPDEAAQGRRQRITATCHGVP